MGTTKIAFGSAGSVLQRHTLPRGGLVITYARKQGKKGRKEQKQNAEGVDPIKTRVVLENLDQELPQAPSPRERPPRQSELSPGDIYPVFAPQSGTSSAAPWRWDDDGEQDQPAQAPRDEEPLPAWNPRTGFMRTAAELQAEAGSATGASTSASVSSAASGTPGSGGAEAELAQSAPGVPSPASSRTNTTAAASSSSSAYLRGRPPPVEVSLTVPPADPLPAAPIGSDGPPLLMPASRNAVLSSALGTGFWMALLAVVFRNFVALSGAKALGTDADAVAELLRWPLGLESLTDVGAAVGAAAAVTATRLALLSVWGDLREATERSNKQVLSNLSSADILLVAVASGVPEELLFRGALLPATFPDWRGVALSAAIFGLLHNSGGRNPAFAVWAGGVGALYGAAYLATGNIWVPAMAHSAANAMSAFVWKARQASGSEDQRKQ